MTAPVLAIDPDRRGNADLIADAARLGYLYGTVADVTYGSGAFWTRYRPPRLLASDIDPSRGVMVADFRDLPLADSSVDAVVFDPPYKRNGTSTGQGPSAADARYGVTVYRPTAVLDALHRDGITECVRVLRGGGHLLVKAMDMVASGRVHWSTHDSAAHAGTLGCPLVDMLHLLGHRSQPSGRRQVHAARNYSTLLILRRN